MLSKAKHPACGGGVSHSARPPSSDGRNCSGVYHPSLRSRHPGFNRRADPRPSFMRRAQPLIMRCPLDRRPHITAALVVEQPIDAAGANPCPPGRTPQRCYCPAGSSCRPQHRCNSRLARPSAGSDPSTPRGHRDSPTASSTDRSDAPGGDGLLDGAEDRVGRRDNSTGLRVASDPLPDPGEDRPGTRCTAAAPPFVGQDVRHHRSMASTIA